MPMHDDCMKDYGKDYEEYPMYPQMPMMGGMPMMGCGMPYPQMPMMGGMPMPCPQMPMMGDYDKEDLCYMEHMNEYMAYICKAEACKMRAMQCMHKR
ncbi:hypothetical protein FQB35_14095 [Crassaminicella thermophila]|uniref:Uncharacterized protein n=1 Tax=Crassaminicella thermophila TaxID=2599308 RepID=A0A5C0SGI8_CRATE|nr:hypothetical protein [Crassaminicella thermophila]QEK13310.1 hypothetical protein FQB35_14095 [Crassaminicella thermophila]